MVMEDEEREGWMTREIAVGVCGQAGLDGWLFEVPSFQSVTPFQALSGIIVLGDDRADEEGEGGIAMNYRGR